MRITPRQKPRRRAARTALWLSLTLPPFAVAQEPEIPAPPPAPVAEAPAPATPSAAPPAEAPAPVAASGEALEATLAQRDAAQQTFLRLAEEERYDEAVTIAGQIVDLTTRLYGERSIELATPLTNLATAQMRHGDLAAAESSYLASIAIIEATEDLGSTRLINPLVGLGETYTRAGAYEQAVATYRRALQTNHAADGFYNLDQVKILDGLSEGYLGLDKIQQATAQQRIEVAIQRHRSGPNSPDLVPALHKLGRWYNRTGQFPEAREVYQTARRIIRETKGDNDPAMVDSLLGEAITYENEGAVPASASTLKRALDLLDAQPEPDHLKRAEVLVALGDLYTLSRQPRSAAQRYGQAWQELTGDDALLAERDRYFARPSRISGPRLPTIVGADGKEMAEAPDASISLAKGFVVATLTVDTDGMAHNLAVVEADPPGLMDKQVLRSLANTGFRPQLVDGVAVKSDGVQFRHEFRYLRATPSETPAPAAKSESAGEQGERINYPTSPNEPEADPRH